MTENFPLLFSIESPSDLKKLSARELPELAKELRAFLIDTIAINGGHFSANLGVVELAIALHYVFDTPNDKLVWDVGHQAYAHKILTGRRSVFHTNRKKGGISGFPKREESAYDAFGTGHSSTSISSILGMAVSASLSGNKQRQHVAIIGDGALTGGMAFEALNHAGSLETNLLVILNDNSMSIDPGTGALKHYLKSLDTEDGSFFSSLNFNYFGPIDGHDLVALCKELNRLKTISGPKLLHIKTVKGKGYAPAEQEQTYWHAPGTFDKLSGELNAGKQSVPKGPRYQDVFGYTLLELAQGNDKIIGITPAMPSGCSMNIMMEALPERVFDVGIAEQHAVTFAAGLATDGFIPFCNLYSTFAQRAYDQIIHDVCVQKLPVVFCLDRAGLVGADGPTHHGAFDIAFLRCLPEMVIAAPLDEVELRNMMQTASLYTAGPISIRYPRGNGMNTAWRNPMQAIEIGKGVVLNEGNNVAVLSIGTIGGIVSEAIQELKTEGINPTHANMRFVKPLDQELVLDIARKHNAIITVEDGCLNGGFGSLILECFSDHGVIIPVIRLGIPDEFIEQGTPAELYTYCGLDSKGIADAVRRIS